VAEYTSDIRHVAGQKNLVADALSRPPSGQPVESLSQLQPLAAEVAAAVELVLGGKVTIKEIVAAQVDCRETQALGGRPDVKLVTLTGH